MATPDTRADALIAELVDEALGPLESLLPPDVAALFRAELGDTLACHPHGALLVRRALPDPTVEKSGDVSRHGADVAAAPSSGKAVELGSVTIEPELDRVTLVWGGRIEVAGPYEQDVCDRMPSAATFSA